MNNLFWKLSKIKNRPRPDQNTAGTVLKLPNTICFRSNFLFNFIYERIFTTSKDTYSTRNDELPFKNSVLKLQSRDASAVSSLFWLGFSHCPAAGRSKSRVLSTPGMTCKTMKTSSRRRCPGLARAVATAFLLAAGFTGAVFSSERVWGRPVPTAPSILWGCEGVTTLRAGRFCSRNAGDCTCARWRHTHTWETLVNKTMTDWHVLVQCHVCLDDGTKDIVASAMMSSSFGVSEMNAGMNMKTCTCNTLQSCVHSILTQWYVGTMLSSVRCHCKFSV